jgi:hypothetical protein
LSDVCKDLFSLLENYEDGFGDCHNKLRLLLDLLSVSYKLSFVFVLDGSLQDRLRTEVIAKSGERMTAALCQTRGIKGPFSLENRHGNLEEDGEESKQMSSILDVIRCFT